MKIVFLLIFAIIISFVFTYFYDDGSKIKKIVRKVDPRKKMFYKEISYYEWEEKAKKYYEEKMSEKVTRTSSELRDDNYIINLFDGEELLDSYRIDNDLNIKNKKNKKIEFE